MNSTEKLLHEWAIDEWQERVIDERKELEIRLYKLNKFMNGKEFDKLDQAEKYRMQDQRNSMRAYSQALTERIAFFS